MMSETSKGKDMFFILSKRLPLIAFNSLLHGHIPKLLPTKKVLLKFNLKKSHCFGV